MVGPTGTLATNQFSKDNLGALAKQSFASWHLDLYLIGQYAGVCVCMLSVPVCTGQKNVCSSMSSLQYMLNNCWVFQAASAKGWGDAVPRIPPNVPRLSCPSILLAAICFKCVSPTNIVQILLSNDTLLGCHYLWAEGVCGKALLCNLFLLSFPFVLMGVIPKIWPHMKCLRVREKVKLFTWNMGTDFNKCPPALGAGSEVV